MHLIIGNQNYSSWSMRPWVAMTHFGIAFQQTKIELDTPTFKQQVVQFGNAQTVPVLVTENGTATDSLSILETLADQYPHMWPRDPALKLASRNAVARMHSGLFALRGEMPMNCRANQRLLDITPACRNDINEVQALWASCMAKAAEKGQDQGYLLGGLSIADAFFAPVVMRLKGYNVPVNDVTHQYMNTMLANPAVRAWIAAGLSEATVLEADEAGIDPA